jgi:leucyl aminopeptidase (aminopeptidase T)/transposase
MRVAPAVTLSPEERTVLERWARRNSSRDFRALRARIVLRASEGSEDRQIGDDLGIHRLTVARWRARFLASRVRGLAQKLAPSSRRGRILDEQVRAIVRAAIARRGEGPRAWSTRDVARRVGVSHSTVQRVWEAYGIRPAGYDAWPPRPDPITPRAPLDVVGVYLWPPDYAVAFALGPGAVEAPRPTAKNAVAPRASELVPGFDRFIERRLGPDGAPMPARRRRFLRFLGEVEAEFGEGREIRILVTGRHLASSEDLESWSTRHPLAQFDYAEGIERWRERLTRHIRALGRGPTGGYGFGARGELARVLTLYLTSYAEGSGHFEWVASAADVAARAAGFRLRHDLSVTGHPGFKSPTALASGMNPARGPDPRAREMARVVLRKSLRVTSGERVSIESWTETLEYANAFVLETLRLGARPLLLYQDEPTYWAAASEVRPANLSKLGDHWRAALSRSDVLVSFFGPSDRERFHALPRPTMFKLSEYRDALYEVASKAGVRAVQIALGRASEASARMYGVDLGPWRDELVDGTLVNPDELHRRALRVARRLRGGKEVVIRHPNGTNVRLELGRRPLEISDGLVARASKRGSWNLVQLPAGVVTATLIPGVAEGIFHGNVGTAVGMSVAVGEVAGGRWTFEGGRLTRATYDRGQELFDQTFQTAGPGRNRPGTLSIGLNPKISASPLLEDQGLGTITLQIGYSPEAWRGPRSAWRGWLLLRGADLEVDGRSVVKGGSLVP